VNLTAMDVIFLLITLLLALATLPGSVYLLVLSIAGMRAPLRFRPVAMPAGTGRQCPGSIVVIVPAHNEATSIARTLDNLLTIARSDGAAQVVVIADNCVDATATVAAASGARVLERHDDLRRGKGYALDWAFQQLAGEEHFGYVVIDADSVADTNLLCSIREHFARGAQAVQARYTVLNAQQSPRTRLAELALLAFNCLRPRAREVLGVSAGILGNGFALRRHVLDQVPYCATSVVEDLEYHLELVENGVRVHFADDTSVRGEMPVAGSAQGTQRARWEGGRLRMLREHGPALLRRVASGQLRFIDPLLDLLLLPLGYHALLLCLLVLFPGILAKAMGLAGLAILAGHVLAAARLGGIAPRALARIAIGIPFYVAWKLTVLRNTLVASGHSMRWVRTDRHSSR